MNDFNSRWQQILRSAKDAAPDLADAAPYGFATRVLSLRAAAASRARLSILALWHRLTLRALGFALVIVIVGLVLNFAIAEDDSLSPPIADSIADAFWLQ
jgi:hypothetical protein